MRRNSSRDPSLFAPTQRDEPQVVMIGAGLANLIAARKICEWESPQTTAKIKVTLLERASLLSASETPDYRHFPPAASLVTPGRGCFGVGHYTDRETTELILKSLFALLEDDPELVFLSNRTTQYLIRNDSMPLPPAVVEAYEYFRRAYAKKYRASQTSESVRKRLPKPEDLYQILRQQDDGKWQEQDTIGLNGQYLNEHIKVIVRTLEGRLDMVGAYQRAVKAARAAGVVIRDNFVVDGLTDNKDGTATVRGHTLAPQTVSGPVIEEQFTAPVVVVGAWYNTMKLIRETYPNIEDPYSYRIKQIVDILVPVTEGLESFFEGLNAKGCMLALDKNQVVEREGKNYWHAKATSVFPTNISLLQKSDEVEPVLAEVRADQDSIDRRSWQIIERICEVAGLSSEDIRLEKAECQVVVTDKIEQALDEKLQRTLEKGMGLPGSAFNMRREVRVKKIETDDGADHASVISALNFKLVQASKTARCVFQAVTSALEKRATTSIKPAVTIPKKVKIARFEDAGGVTRLVDATPPPPTPTPTSLPAAPLHLGTRGEDTRLTRSLTEEHPKKSDLTRSRGGRQRPYSTVSFDEERTLWYHEHSPPPERPRSSGCGQQSVSFFNSVQPPFNFIGAASSLGSLAEGFLEVDGGGDLSPKTTFKVY